jgi:hypothetical protein
MTPLWKRELTLTGVLLAIGLLVLPLSIFAVGQQVIGEYEGGIVGLMGAIWAALAGGQWPAWLLVLSPYVVVQLLRLTRTIVRSRRV